MSSNILLRGALLLVILASSAVSQELVESEPDRAELVRLLSEKIQERIDRGDFPALSIALVDDQRIAWAQGFGKADPVHHKAATAKTVFRFGSVSKLFTAFAAMQLVEQGKLDLDAPVTKYLKDFRPQNPCNAPITVRQLLSHRSGLVRESPIGSYFDSTSPTIEATVASLNRTALVYEPGTRTKYSNAGVAVVGQVVEAITAQPFTDYVRENLLRPLRMDSSDFLLSSELRTRLARAEMWTYDGRVFQAPDFPLGTLPAGNLYSTVLDLGRFLSMLFADGALPTGRLVRPETLRDMLKPQFASPGSKTGYGIGFALSNWSQDGEEPALLRIGHGGAVYGFSTEVAALPERKLGVIVVSSRDCTNGAVRELANLALSLLVSQRVPQELGPKAVRKLVSSEAEGPREGRYRRGRDGIEIWRDGANWVGMENRGGVQRILEFWSDGGMTVRPLIDEGPLLAGRSGEMTWDRALGRLVIGGEEFLWEEELRPPPPPQSWLGLIGEYGPDHNVLTILERDGKLHTLIEWCFLYPLEERGPGRFAFPDWGLYHGEELVFQCDQDGRATEVTAGGVRFARRAIRGELGETFRIQPVAPIEDLRAKTSSAKPPMENREFWSEDLIDLASLDPTIRLDIRYATTNNFLGAPVYTQPRAFLQRPAAEALALVHEKLKSRGYGLLIHDAYRPWAITKLFWEATPEESRGFVADPDRGSKHNRGCAVDLTLFDRSTGEPVLMVSGYDEFSPRAAAFYPGGTSLQRWHRGVLRRAMAEEGFEVISNEWWHFDYKDWPSYSLQNSTFEELTDRKSP